MTCPGCGGLAQTVDHGEAGFYDVSRKTVKHFLENDRSPFTSENATTHNDAFDRAATAAGSGLEAELQALKEATGTTEAPFTRVTLTDTVSRHRSRFSAAL